MHKYCVNKGFWSDWSHPTCLTGNDAASEWPSGAHTPEEDYCESVVWLCVGSGECCPSSSASGASIGGSCCSILGAGSWCFWGCRTVLSYGGLRCSVCLPHLWPSTPTQYWHTHTHTHMHLWFGPSSTSLFLWCTHHFTLLINNIVRDTFIAMTVLFFLLRLCIFWLFFLFFIVSLLRLSIWLLLTRSSWYCLPRCWTGYL